jgi:putative restriction endonuclease
MEQAADNRFRLAAIGHLQRVATDGVVTADDLRTGFFIDDERIPLINPQRGIFKPTVMCYLLSIRTVFPVSGRKVWYDDQRRVHEQIARGDELIDYAFMGSDAEAADNRWLREAMEAQVPIIYFLGVAPQRYSVIWPVYIAGWSASELKAQLAFAPPASIQPAWIIPPAPERRYGLRIVKQRLHQATFREAVLAAYGGRCAISNLPEPRLLDAAHIMPDVHEALGQPVVSNGLPMSKIHHAAFDANLMGIDPDFRVHIAEELLAMNDGPMLEQGIKAMAGRLIRPAKREMDNPDRDRLAQRFELFKQRI